MGRSVPFLPMPWDQRIQIVQTQDEVAIQDEEGELRLTSLTEMAPLPESIRQWAGSSRGHWEDDTLVVETTHFNGKWSFQGAGPQMRLVERFTRTAGGTLDYQFTVQDPESFESSWTGPPTDCAGLCAELNGHMWGKLGIHGETGPSGCCPRNCAVSMVYINLLASRHFMSGRGAAR